jgi:FkbM family methyltransferase
MLARFRRRLPSSLVRGLRWIARPSYRARRRERKQAERERARLRALPRYEPTATDLLGQPLRVPDAASFLSAHQAIFEQGIYAFETGHDAPRILDGGANIGLATLYWKRRHPGARITAFEPDPAIFEVLAWNCRTHGLHDVELVPRGLWSQDGTLRFAPDGADGGHVTPAGHETEATHEEAAAAGTTSVAVTRLRPYLEAEARVDLLKLDIEGAETEVLLDCDGALGHVQRVFVEFHSYVGQEQCLDDVVGVLARAGFRLHAQPELVSPQPFVRHLDDHGMDHRLNLFAYRV